MANITNITKHNQGSQRLLGKDCQVVAFGILVILAMLAAFNLVLRSPVCLRRAVASSRRRDGSSLPPSQGGSFASAFFAWSEASKEGCSGGHKSWVAVTGD